MKNTEFCEKINRKLGGRLKLVEQERDYFRVKTNCIWLKDNQSIYLSNEFKEWLEVFAWRRLKKHVKWDNLDLAFWFEGD